MLAISNKLSEPLELSCQILEYCQNAFGPDSLASVKPFATLVDELRVEALTSSTNTVEAQRNGLRRYLGALDVIEEEFPIGQPVSIATKVRFPATTFVWSDSFRPRVKARGASVRFERACVVFNFAANQSLLARDTDRATPEGQKQAVALYQQAAGVFILLRDQILPACVAAGDSMGMDLTDGAVSMCASLMLAQAQALFYEKAVKDKSSKGLLAKLANQAANFYGTAFSMAQSLKNHVDPSWATHCRFQELLFLAAAHFQQAMADKANVVAKLSGFGGLVSRLRFARDLAASVDQLPNMTPGALSAIVALREAIKAELGPIEYDNTNVYIEVVPNKDALPPIGLVPAVKAATVNYASDLVDMSYVEAYAASLDSLAPIELKKKVDWLDGETAKYINKLNSVHGCMKLKPVPFPLTAGVPVVPVDAAGNVEPISDDIWSKIARIQVLGGPLALDGQLASLHGLTGECEGMIMFIQRALDEEERDDKSCRDRFGHGRFTRMSSVELTGQFRTQLANYRSKLALAVDTNKKVSDRIGSQDKNLVMLLGRSRDELKSIWTEKIQQSLREKAIVNPATETLKDDCRQKVSVTEAVIAEFKTKVDEYARKYGHSAARTADVLKSGPDLEASVLAIAQEAEVECKNLGEEMMSQFTHANAELDAALSSLLQHLGGDGSSHHSKGHWLQALQTCSSVVLQGFSDIGEGLTFFRKLNDYLKKLKIQVDDFCFARNEEKNGILANIQRGLAASGREIDQTPFGNSPQIPFGSNH